LQVGQSTNATYSAHKQQCIVYSKIQDNNSDDLTDNLNY